MATTEAQIDLWRQEPSEHQHLEFKEAKRRFDREKLFKYCVAIANEGGGVLLLGIADEASRPVVGTHAFQGVVALAHEVFEAVGFRVDVEEVQHSDGRVVVFHIPSRPKGTAYNFRGAYLMRCGESLVPMSEDKLRQIFAEGEPAWLEEPSIRGLGGQEVVELLDVQGFFELQKLPYPTSQIGVLERLVQERLIDEDSVGYSVRRLGALLLARRLSDFPDVARKAPRVVIYDGVSKLKTRLDRTWTQGYAVGFEGLVEFVTDQLPQNELIEEALRESVKLVPPVVVRELVANSLVHQDFEVGGASVMLEVYDNRVEFSNPGEPIVQVERFIDGYQSRNERLADLMRRFGICEEKSSGIDRVVEAAEVFQLPAPDFRSDQCRTIVVIHGPRPFADMDVNDRVRACYQHCALRYVMSQRMTNQSLRERFRLPSSSSATVTVSQVIKATIAAGLIKADEAAGGSRRFARYLPYWA